MGDNVLSDFISKLNVQIGGLGKLINRLLDVSKLQSGQLKINRKQFNFSDLMSEVIASMQEYAKDCRIEYTQKIGKNFKIKADKELISQVLVNLLSNAIKYSGEKGRVVLVVKKDRNKVLVSTQDFGIGIAYGEQSKVFQRFFRTGAALKNKINGVGLGLYIVKEIITGHGGKVWLESREGVGSTFYFTLPIK